MNQIHTLKPAHAKAMTQSDIDNMGLSKIDSARFTPGWYWMSSWPAFEKGQVLVIFTPFHDPKNDIAVFFKAREIL